MALTPAERAWREEISQRYEASVARAHESWSLEQLRILGELEQRERDALATATRATGLARQYANRITCTRAAFATLLDLLDEHAEAITEETSRVHAGTGDIASAALAALATEIREVANA